MASTVGTSTQSDASGYSCQRNGFVAHSLCWVFYSDGINLLWKTSGDGESWSAATTVRACDEGNKFAIWFDGTYVHYCYSSGAADQPLYYRRGTPNADGTITWSAAEQTAVTPWAGHYIINPNVAVDSDGCPWVAYDHYRAGIRGYPNASKSSASDGTWATESNFPKEFVQTRSATWWQEFVPLTDGKMYVITCRTAYHIYGSLWDGAAWSVTMEQITTSGYQIVGGYKHSAVAIDDDIYLVWDDSSNVAFNKRTYGVGWDSCSRVWSVSGTWHGPALGKDENELLYCFVLCDNDVCYKTYDGSWSAAVILVDDEVTSHLNYNHPTCFRTTADYGVVWRKNSASPFQVRFAYVTAVAIAVPRHHPIHATIPNIPYRRPKPDLIGIGG